MQKYYTASASIRVLYFMRNTKLISNFHVHFSRVVEVPRPLSFSFCRVICTDITAQNRLQTTTQLTPFQASYLVPFLKENFDIVENRYFELISKSNVNHLEELLKKEELKELISKSPFTFDVKISNSTYNDYFQLCSHTKLDSTNKGETLHNGTYPEHFKKLTLTSSSEKDEKNLALFTSSKKDEKDLTRLSSCKKVEEELNFCSSRTENESNSGKPTEQQLLNIIKRLTYNLLNFFERPHDFSIYHKNIVFQNNLLGITIRGLTAYTQKMYLLRLYGYIHYAKVKVEILKITHHIEDGTVRVRWRVDGVPRGQLLINLWKQKKLFVPPEDTEWVDGFSVFSVDSGGLIYRHVCDKMSPDGNEVMAKKLDLKSKLLRLLGNLQQRPVSLHASYCKR